MRKELSDVTLPRLLGYLDRMLERSKSTFFAGDEITICDLVIYTRMKWLRRGVSTNGRAQALSRSIGLEA